MGAVGKNHAMDGLLRRSLAQSKRSEDSVCPEPEILAAYFERSLGVDETAACETHFAGCARCRAQLAAMVRAEEAPPPVRAKAWIWDWRWLAATAAVLALTATATWEMRRSALVGKGAEAPLVAMSQPQQLTPPLPSPGAETGAGAPSAAAPKLVPPALPLHLPALAADSNRSGAARGCARQEADCAARRGSQ